MKELRFIHTADWHWGAHHAHPIYSSNAIIDLGIAAITRGCNLVLVAGDIFDKPNPNQRIKDHLVEQLLPFWNKLRFVFLVGNHDYTSKSKDYHCINYLKYFDRLMFRESTIHVLEPGQSIRIEASAGVFVNIFGMDEFGDLTNYNACPDEYNLIMWHGMVPGIDFTRKDLLSKQSTKAVEELLHKSQAHYIAMGDIHQNIRIGKRCAYSGPPVQKGYADSAVVNDIYLNGADITIKRCDLGLPKKVVKVVQDLNIENIIKDVQKTVRRGDILRLTFDMPLEEWAAFGKERLTSALSDEYACTVMNRPVSIDTPIQITPRTSTRTLDDDLKFLIKELCSKSTRKAVYKTCKDIIKEVHDSSD